MVFREKALPELLIFYCEAVSADRPCPGINVVAQEMENSRDESPAKTALQRDRYVLHDGPADTRATCLRIADASLFTGTEHANFTLWRLGLRLGLLWTRLFDGYHGLK